MIVSFQVFKKRAELLARFYGYKNFDEAFQQFDLIGNTVFVSTDNLDLADALSVSFRNCSLGCEIEIFVEGKLYNVGNSGLPNKGFDSQMLTLTSAELPVDLTEIYKNENPVYFTNMIDESIMFCNPKALEAQQKTVQQLLNRSSLPLNNHDELAKRNRLIQTDKKLTGYEFVAWRWFQTMESINGVTYETHKRKEHSFVGNFMMFDFLGVPCRMSEIVVAEPLTKVI